LIFKHHVFDFGVQRFENICNAIMRFFTSCFVLMFLEFLLGFVVTLMNSFMLSTFLDIEMRKWIFLIFTEIGVFNKISKCLRVTVDKSSIGLLLASWLGGAAEVLLNKLIGERHIIKNHIKNLFVGVVLLQTLFDVLEVGDEADLGGKRTKFG